MTIKLGQTVRDCVTKFTGIAVSQHILFGGATQFGVQPPIRDEKDSTLIPESKVFDDNQLEFVDDGIVATAVAPDQSIELGNGMELEDRASHFRGTVIETVIFLNGCTYFHLVSNDQKTRDGKAVALFAPWQRFKFISNGLLDPVKDPALDQPPLVESAPKKPKGGPVRDALIRETAKRD